MLVLKEWDFSLLQEMQSFLHARRRNTFPTVVTNTITVYVNTSDPTRHVVVETALVKCTVVKKLDCILVYGRTTKGDVVKKFYCILVYGSTIKGGVVKRSDCILVYGSTTKGDVVKRSDCILVYGSTTKGDVVKRSDCILVYGSTTKGGVVKRSDCICVPRLTFTSAAMCFPLSPPVLLFRLSRRLSRVHRDLTAFLSLAFIKKDS